MVGINVVVVVIGSVNVGIIAAVGVVLKIFEFMFELVCWKQRTFSYNGMDFEQLEPEQVLCLYLNPLGEQSEHAVQGDHSDKWALS